MNQRADAGNDHQHDHGELVYREIPAYVERTALNPGKVVLVDGVCGEVAGGEVNLENPAEREYDAQDGDSIDHDPAHLTAEDPVDQEPDERERGDNPEIMHQFFRESISSMFRVARFL